MVTILKTEVFPHFIFCVLSTHIVFQDKDYEHLIKILTFYAEFLDILHFKQSMHWQTQWFDQMLANDN